MSLLVNMQGLIIGHLHVINISSKSASNGTRFWKCKCLCGKYALINGATLRRGSVKSCGCLQGKHGVRTSKNKHGFCTGQTSKEKKPHPKFGMYRSYRNMLSRCYNSKTPKYEYYGGKGVKVCEKWKKEFKYFLKDMEKTWFPKASLDRIDSNGNYTPKNCQWLTVSENARRVFTDKMFQTRYSNVNKS